MKRVLGIILLSLISVFGFGQQVNAPSPKSFAKSVSGQDASGFSLSGFGTTDILLCAIGLPQAPSGTTFSLVTTTGLTPATGYSMVGNKSRLAFTGTMANINNALATLKINTTSTAGVIQISVSATINPAGYYYNPSNGHFYRPVSTTATYPNAKLLSSQQTFKGQQGYLVTLTSSDEENFVILNVPQNNIWIALTDEVTEAQWKIDAGPEAGTLIKTSNGQTAGNIVGQYNNWCGGEPNNAGNEDYAVTKWGGGSCWNDLPAHFSNPYIIEFGTWTNPDDQTFTNFYSNSVSHSNGDIFRVSYNFSFLNLDETKFSIRTKALANGLWTPYTQNYKPLNGIGVVDMTNETDATTIQNGNKGSITATVGPPPAPGEAEWAYVNLDNSSRRLYIDLRKFGTTQPSDVSSISILDCYNGPVTYLSSDIYWAVYQINDPLTKVTDGTSIYVSSIRNAGYNNWAFTCNVSFTANMEMKKQGIEFKEPTSQELSTNLDAIVTVADVYLAFKQLADGGIFGNSNTYFTSPIQFMNADVDGNGVFNEADCFRLLQHLKGDKALLDTNNLSAFMKILKKSEYDAITNSNWTTYDNTTKNSYLNLTLANSNSLNAFSLNVFWKGDVNMSHSPSQTNGIGGRMNNISSITSQAVLNKTTSSNLPTSYIVSQLKGDSVILTIKFNPNGNQLSGAQYKVNYDKTILNFDKVIFKTTGSPTNFDNDRGGYINFGSLLTDGNILENIEYQIVFKTSQKLNNSLGLVSISDNQAVSLNGNVYKIKMQ